MSFNPDSVYKKPEDVVARANQDGTFVVMKMDDSNIFFKIEGVSTLVWKGLIEGQTPKKLSDSITKEYNVSIDQVTKDIEEFIGKLLEKDLIQKV